MSARMETEPMNWRGTEIEQEATAADLSAIQVECLIRNSDNRNLIASVREVHATLRESPGNEATKNKRRTALALQEQWDAWFVERDQLRAEIKRGRECLEQVRREVATLRARLEEWSAYERICGKNPLNDYMQSMAARENIEKFLPSWLERREDQLKSLENKMADYAKEHDVEHLL